MPNPKQNNLLLLRYGNGFNAEKPSGFYPKRTLGAFLVAVFLLLAITPAIVSAKAVYPKGYTQDKGKEISVSQPLGWPVSVRSSSYIAGSIDSLPQMAVLRLKTYNPWWRFWKRTLPEETTISVSGLPKNTNLYIYTNGYREENILNTNPQGTLELSFPSEIGQQFIIKTKPSTIRIAIDPFFGPPGGDCNQVGAWNPDTKTCALTQNLTEPIVIEDDNITLDGNNHTLTGSGTEDGVYVDKANVIVRNLTVRNFGRGIVYAAPFPLFSIPKGGLISNVSLISNPRNIVVEGVSETLISRANINTGENGIFLTDKQLDGFVTYDISVTNSTIKNTNIGLFASEVSPITFLRNNVIANTTDLSLEASNILLSSVPLRGNYWSKNTACKQDPANPSYCLDPYNSPEGLTDHRPWACENGWITTCPVEPPPPPDGNGEEPPPSSGTYGICDGNPVIGDFVEIYNATGGGLDLLETPTSTSRLMKRVPNGWVFQVVDISDPTYIKVKDLGTMLMGEDVSTGYIPKDNACPNPSRQSEFENKTKVYNSTTSTSSIAARKQLIVDSVENYYNNGEDGDITLQLYAMGGGRGGGNFFNTTTKSSYYRPVLLAIIQQETGEQHKYDNRICSSDGVGGIGVGQMTSRGYKGRGANLTNVFDSRYTQYFDDCYGKDNESVAYYYTNTKQGIFAAVKDATRRLSDLYNASTVWGIRDVEDTSITKEDMHWAVATYSYNQGSPFKALFAYYAWKSNKTASTSAEVLQQLKDLRYKNAKGGGLIGDTDTEKERWIQRVKDLCNGLEQRPCLERLTDAGVFSAPALYLEQVGKKLVENKFGSVGENAVLGNKFIKINTSHLITGLASPAVLQVTDSQGRRTGIFGNSEVTEIPNTYNHTETESVVLFFPDPNNIYRVVGLETGTYDFVAIKPTEDSVLFFTAVAIPIIPGAVHTYQFNWDVIASNGNGVTINVDQNGDGVTDKTLTSDWQFTSEEFQAATGINADSKKVTICHIPPGRPDNAHTITIGLPALKAHLAHDDTMGECPVATPTGFSPQGKRKKKQ